MSCAYRSMRPMPGRSLRCAARTCSIASCAMCGASPNCSAGPVPRRRACRLWLTGLKETIEQLPAFVRLAASMGVREVLSAAAGIRRSRLWPGARRIVAVRAAARRRIAGDRGCDRTGARSWRRARCIRRHRAWAQPEAAGRDAALVGVPAALVADVFHRAWPRAAVLHGAVLGARLRQLYAG